MAWILIFWIVMDRGGGPATAEFGSKEACEAAGRAVFDAPKYMGYQLKSSGNYVCVPK